MFTGLVVDEPVLAATPFKYAVATYVAVPPPVLDDAVNDTLTPVGVAYGKSATLRPVAGVGLV
jgi:hypothetical protein